MGTRRYGEGGPDLENSIALSLTIVFVLPSLAPPVILPTSKCVGKMCGKESRADDAGKSVGACHDTMHSWRRTPAENPCRGCRGGASLDTHPACPDMLPGSAAHTLTLPLRSVLSDPGLIL